MDSFTTKQKEELLEIMLFYRSLHLDIQIETNEITFINENSHHHVEFFLGGDHSLDSARRILVESYDNIMLDTEILTHEEARISGIDQIKWITQESKYKRRRLIPQSTLDKEKSFIERIRLSSK